MKTIRILFLLLLLTGLAALGVIGGRYVRDKAALERIPALQRADFSVLKPAAAPNPETELGQALYQARMAVWQWEETGEARYDGGPADRSAEQVLTVCTLNVDALTAGLAEEMQSTLSAQAQAALRSDEVYDGDGHFREELCREAFVQALTARLAQAELFEQRRSETLRLDWRPEKATWEAREDEALRRLRSLREEQERDPDAEAEQLYQGAAAALQPVWKSYEPLEETATSGPAPNPAFFGETQDPAELAALLDCVTAKRLIKGQTLVWNPELALFPGSSLRYYLDDTILVIVWQEVEAQAVGTFAEVFVADGSQLRRKISGDELFSFAFETTSEFCQNTNAVLAVGGDFYHHARECGICVYQRQICRFDPKTCDTCYITTEGDLLFSYRDQFETREQAARFLEENDVLFSVAFGPVLIDDGVDVTPERYPWGEIDDTYARSALGLLGEHHYLTMNINCGSPGSEYYYLATLRQAADAMLARGCVKAYTLDGGQTATTAFRGELINPVQFGKEKPISDVIYFATAVPEGK